LPPTESVHLKHFAHETLPKKLWRKYSYASLFVSNIKAKTPKITLYTKRAKFQLMENSDVEVTFYNGEDTFFFERAVDLLCLLHA
jgi:polo-like kinase 4